MARSPGRRRPAAGAEPRPAAGLAGGAGPAPVRHLPRAPAPTTATRATSPTARGGRGGGVRSSPRAGAAATAAANRTRLRGPVGWSAPRRRRGPAAEQDPEEGGGDRLEIVRPLEHLYGSFKIDLVHPAERPQE